MKPKHSSQPKASAERVVKDIRRATRRHFSAEDKIRIVLEGLRGEDSIAELCRKEGIAQSLYYTWSKDNGVTFAKNIKVADYSCECCRIAMSETHQGDAAAFWRLGSAGCTVELGQ